MEYFEGGKRNIYAERVHDAEFFTIEYLEQTIVHLVWFTIQ